MNDHTVKLNGRWLIRADPGNVGLAEGWFREPDSFLSERHTQPINIPCAWQHVLGEEYHYLAWYRRTIRIPAEWNHPRARIRFESVATELDLWIDGKHLGRHCGDWIPVEFDVTEQARPGSSVEIIARVDEKLGHITKGFHDLLSIHHGGIWGDVFLVGTGELFARANGVWVRPDAKTGEVEIICELAESSAAEGTLRVEINAPDGTKLQGETEFAGERTPRLRLGVDAVHRWSPENPNLYRATVTLRDLNGHDDVHIIPFGFRTIGTRGSRVLLNGSPIHLRGVLHWGHEPRHLAPAPPPEQVRAEFAALRERGFNSVCLCMWYPPRHYYEIADETGMLLWQEHPVWHSPMDEEFLTQYRRLYQEFMRRDRNHPSVIIVSATCEHPCFHRDLADWWWKTSHEMLPDRLRQVQTSSFAWSNPDQTDLYDEHTYDNNDRWPHYLTDVQAKLAQLPTKPFVMGESVAFVTWPDVVAIRKCRSQSQRWSLPTSADEIEQIEKSLQTQTANEDILARFRRQADRHALLGRKFQVEVFRRYPNHAGLVMNHLRDVPNSACGFMDAIGRWRFAPDELRSWQSDAVLLLKTPGERRSFNSEETAQCELLLSNFSGKERMGRATIRIDGEIHLHVPLKCPPGEVARAAFNAQFPHAAEPRRVRIDARLDDVANVWDLWAFPSIDLPGYVYRLVGCPFDSPDFEPDEVERGYSRGFGLPVRSWKSHLPDPAAFAPGARPWHFDGPVPDDAALILSHKLTARLITFLENSGRAILFASKTAGGLGGQYEWMFGQCPLVLEEGPLREHDSEWIVDLLSFDLTRRYCRVFPTDDFGWRDRVQPIIRLVYFHDQKRLRMLDSLFLFRVGGGVFAISLLDHRDPAGAYLLGRLIQFLTTCDPELVERAVSPDELRKFAIDGR